MRYCDSNQCTGKWFEKFRLFIITNLTHREQIFLPEARFCHNLDLEEKTFSWIRGAMYRDWTSIHHFCCQIFLFFIYFFFSWKKAGDHFETFKFDGYIVFPIICRNCFLERVLYENFHFFFWKNPRDLAKSIIFGAQFVFCGI